MDKLIAIAVALANINGFNWATSKSALPSLHGPITSH